MELLISEYAVLSNSEHLKANGNVKKEVLKNNY